ncbi:hypothetical protein GCM10010394_49210 [Streptomyces crystallinus]|uniref:Secreted protein n=1 Tax=Streptomyces crystallinus TaxID=68191 RepID=A0ABN1GKI6_9ACTN
MSCGTRAQTAARAILMALELLRSFLWNHSLTYCWYCELHLLLLRYCSWRPLITAGHPVRPSVPSPSCNRSGFGTPPSNRLAYYTYLYCGYHCLAVRLCRALRDLGYERNTNWISAQSLLRPT